jgi:hypothetical protein
MNAAEDGVNAIRPDGFGDKLHVAVATVEPGTGALRGFYGGQDYLESQLNWALAGGSGRLDVQAVRARGGPQGGLLAQGHLRRQLALLLQRRGHGPVVVNEDADHDYGSAVNLIKATEKSINTAFADLTDVDPRRPAEDHRDRRRRHGHPAGKELGQQPAYKSARPRGRRRHRARLGDDQRRSTWPTPTRRSPTAARPRALP